MNRKNQKKEFKKKSLHMFDIFLISIQFVLSGFLAYLAKKVLPMKYWLIVVAIFLVIWLLVFFVLKNRKNSLKQMWMRIVSLILSILIGTTSTLAYKGVSVLNNITGGKYQTQVISVVVLKDSSYNAIKDLNSKNIGAVSSLDSNNITKALENISNKEKSTLSKTEYSSLEELQKALFNGKTEAIIFNEAYRGIIEEVNKTFSSDTRVIYQYEIKEELSKNTSAVNVTKDSFNVYISGIDTYGSVSTVSRSDVNMIMTVNPKKKEILLTSIPRDYYVTLASFNAKDKLTHSGIYGIDETMSTVENLLGVDMNYYMRVNFTSLITMVDAVGGVNVNVTQPATLGNGMSVYPGQTYMDGETALAFSRERYSYADGDRQRVKNQQLVLTGLLNKLMSSAIISNYSSVMNSVSGAFETNMQAGDLQSLIQMQLDNMSGWKIEQISIDGTGSTSTSCYAMPGYELYVMEPDYSTVSAATQKIKDIMND